MARRLSVHLSCFLLACGAFAGAHAAELGDARVGSHIGQQLVADIELTALDDPAHAVQVRLASPDVYRGATVDMPAVLASLNMGVMRRDGRQFLHVTSLTPVQADHLHLFVELGDGGRRTVRLATLWFTPDPTPPAPAPAPLVVEPPPLALPLTKAPAPTPVKMTRAPVAQACPRQPVAGADPVCAALDGKSAELRAEVAKLEEKVKVLQAAAQSRAVTAPKAAPVPTKTAAVPAKAVPARAQPAAVPVKAVPVRVGTAAVPAKAVPAHARAVAVAARALQPQQVSAAVVKPEAVASSEKPAKPGPVAAPGGMPWGWIGAGGVAVFFAVGAFRLWRRQRERRRMYAKLKARAGGTLPAEPTMG
jgi:hypothetical protein